ncbi:MAG: LTA synthase family protein [Smithella sp.]
MSRYTREIAKLVSKVWAVRQQWLLPAILITLFLIQTQVFNIWLNIKPLLSWQRLASALAFGTCVFGPAIVLYRKTRYIWITISAILIELLFVAQFIYFLSLNTFIRGSAIRYASYVGTVGDSIKIQLSPALLFFITMLPIIALWYWFVDRRTPQLRYRRRTRLVGLVAILLIGISFFAAMLGIEHRRNGRFDELLNVPYDNRYMVAKVGIHMYSVLDTYRYFASPRGITTADKKYVADWAKNRSAAQTPGPYFGAAKGKNVILVLMESFETFALNRRIEGQEITPNLNKLIKESKYFSNYHDDVSAGHTADAEFESQNSLLPTMDRVAFFEYPTHDYNALPEVLDNQKYATAVFHGDAASFWNRNVVYPCLGWKVYHCVDSFKVNRPVGWGLSDEDLIKQCLPKITRIKQPFYVNIMMVTSHTPFSLDKDLKPLKITHNHGITGYQMDYIQTLAYVDKQIGVLINKLKKNGLYDNSILVLFGDHRAYISNEKDTAFAKFIGLNKFDQISFFHDGEHIPMIIHVPGSGITGEDKTPASHLDYAPTILGLLGIKAPRTMLGQDLLSLRQPVAIQRNSAGNIELIETPKVFYTNPGDNNFTSGKCYQANDRKQIKLDSCKKVYDQQSSLARASDLLVRGNALNLLK